MLASYCVVDSVENDTFFLKMEPGHADLMNDKHIDRLQTALTEYLKKPTKINIEAGESGMETPDKLLKEKQAKEKERLALCLLKQ